MNRARLTYFVAAALVVAIVLIGWFGVISPELDQTSAAEDQIATVDAQNQVLSQTLISLKAQSDKLPELTQQLAALRQQIPETPSIDTLVSEMQTLALANGVKLGSLTVPEATLYPTVVAAAPAATAPSGTATPAATPVPTPVPTSLTAPAASAGTSTDVQPSAALKANLYVINLSVQITGTGPSIISFVNALQTGTRLFLVTSVALNTQAAGGVGTATVAGYVFVISTPEEIAARTKAATSTPTASPSPSAAPSATSSASPAPTHTSSSSSTPSPSTTP